MATKPSASNPNHASPSRLARPSDALFVARPPEPSSVPIMPWVIAGAVVLALAVALFLLSRRSPSPTPGTLLPLDPYASSLTLSGLALSEATSLSGGKSTFVDGHVRNAGPRTVTSVTVQVLFGNDEALPPQVETLPLTLIRTREPYVDTQPIASAPLHPGEDREFRLIFENIQSNWNQNYPQIHVVGVEAR